MISKQPKRYFVGRHNIFYLHKVSFYHFAKPRPSTIQNESHTKQNRDHQIIGHIQTKSEPNKTSIQPPEKPTSTDPPLHNIIAFFQNPKNKTRTNYDRPSTLKILTRLHFAQRGGRSQNFECAEEFLRQNENRDGKSVISYFLMTFHNDIENGRNANVGFRMADW